MVIGCLLSLTARSNGTGTPLQTSLQGNMQDFLPLLNIAYNHSLYQQCFSAIGIIMFIHFLYTGPASVTDQNSTCQGETSNFATSEI